MKAFLYKRAGCYIVKSAESRPRRVEGKLPPPDYSPQLTEKDRLLVRALLVHQKEDPE